MYSQLGDIIFEGLKGFYQQDDEVEANYAEHALIETKPRLVRTGSSLREFALAIKFHIAFCNPEEEYDKLDNAREDGTILPFVYGSGFYEGDFVITKLKRTVQQTDDTGQYVEITCELTIKEYVLPDKLAAKQQREQLSGFAVDVDRPTPVPTPRLDKTLSAQLYGAQQKIRNDLFKVTSAINKVENQVNEFLSAPTAIISMGQQFTNVANKMFSDISPMANRVAANLNIMSSLLSGSTDLLAINPTLASSLAGGSTAAAGLTSALSPLTSLPSTITNNSQGQFCLSAFTNLKNAATNLNNSHKNITSDFGLFAIFIAGRKIRL